MSQGDYHQQNRVKASFDAAYTAPTPHRYLHNMAAVGYRMADHMDPVLSAAVDASHTADGSVRVLDLGCSYGVSGALLKTDQSYDQLVAFFQQETSTDYTSCVSASRRWLASHTVRNDVEIVGLDSSEEAVRFAAEAQLIDEGIACNLEAEAAELTGAAARLIRRCSVLLSTGVIGYVTDKTVDPILDEFGCDADGALGPVAVMSVLDLFDPAPIAEVFAQHGYRFGQLPVRMPQRRFADERERIGVVDAMRRRGVSQAPDSVNDTMFASLCVAAQPAQFDALAECVTGAADALA